MINDNDASSSVFLSAPIHWPFILTVLSQTSCHFTRNMHNALLTLCVPSAPPPPTYQNVNSIGKIGVGVFFFPLFWSVLLTAIYQSSSTMPVTQ